MKYIIHFLLFCYSYSYMIDLPFQSFEKEHVRKSNNIRSDFNKNKIDTDFFLKYQSTTKKYYSKKGSETKGRNNLNNITKNPKSLRRHRQRREQAHHVKRRNHAHSVESREHAHHMETKNHAHHPETKRHKHGAETREHAHHWGSRNKDHSVADHARHWESRNKKHSVETREHAYHRGSRHHAHSVETREHAHGVETREHSHGIETREHAHSMEIGEQIHHAQKKLQPRHMETGQRGLPKVNLQGRHRHRHHNAEQEVTKQSYTTTTRRPKSSSLDSSTIERQDFKKEFNDGIWLHKQLEALNQTIPRGDGVNMLAVRPWGVPCGDPNQLDMAEGTCTLSMECDPELRIYRGDHFCKQGQFVCCAILENNYDLNQPFDASFAGSSFGTNTEEKENRGKKDEINVTKEAVIRSENRHKRKAEMRKLIEKIVKEVRSIMNKAYRNETRQKLKKTKKLKRFLHDLKSQYKKDRQAIKDVHDVTMITIDANLRKKIIEMKNVYANFMKNETFRHIVMSGTHLMSKRDAAMLIEAYPEIKPFIPPLRRNIEGDDLDMFYDIEYGLMYY